MLMSPSNTEQSLDPQDPWQIVGHPVHAEAGEVALVGWFRVKG